MTGTGLRGASLVRDSPFNLARFRALAAADALFADEIAGVRRLRAFIWDEDQAPSKRDAERFAASPAANHFGAEWFRANGFRPIGHSSRLALGNDIPPWYSATVYVEGQPSGVARRLNTRSQRRTCEWPGWAPYVAWNGSLMAEVSQVAATLRQTLKWPADEAAQFIVAGIAPGHCYRAEPSPQPRGRPATRNVEIVAFCMEQKRASWSPVTWEALRHRWNASGRGRPSEAAWNFCRDFNYGARVLAPDLRAPIRIARLAPPGRDPSPPVQAGRAE